MRLIHALALSSAAWAHVPPPPGDSQLISIAGGEAEWVSVSRKLELRKAGVEFIDITRSQFQSRQAYPNIPIEYPAAVAYSDTVTALFDQISDANMEENIDELTSYQNRYYESETGQESSDWWLTTVRTVLDDAGALAAGATVEPYDHGYWRQRSIIAKIPGKSDKTIILGAHLDSITGWTRKLEDVNAYAPGADDNASGCATILEAMRVLLTSLDVGMAEHTIEFHWYSAEEPGLYGSMEIFGNYVEEKRVIAAMLNQDMTGFVGSSIDAFGVIDDYTNDDMNDFTKLIITAYCAVKYYDVECGYQCSDHASAYQKFIPSSYVAETIRSGWTPYMHTMEDTLEHLNFTHMHEHVKLCIGWAYELAFAKLDYYDMSPWP